MKSFYCAKWKNIFTEVDTIFVASSTHYEPRYTTQYGGESALPYKEVTSYCSKLSWFILL